MSHLTLVALLYTALVDNLEIAISPAVGLLHLGPLPGRRRILLLLLPPLLGKWVEHLLGRGLLLPLLLGLLPFSLVLKSFHLLFCLFLLR